MSSYSSSFYNSTSTSNVGSSVSNNIYEPTYYENEEWNIRSTPTIPSLNINFGESALNANVFKDLPRTDINVQKALNQMYEYIDNSGTAGNKFLNQLDFAHFGAYGCKVSAVADNALIIKIVDLMFQGKSLDTIFTSDIDIARKETLDYINALYKNDPNGTIISHGANSDLGKLKQDAEKFANGILTKLGVNATVDPALEYTDYNAYLEKLKENPTALREVQVKYDDANPSHTHYLAGTTPADTNKGTLNILDPYEATYNKTWINAKKTDEVRKFNYVPFTNVRLPDTVTPATYSGFKLQNEPMSKGRINKYYLYNWSFTGQ
jgi:hypothetical protein